MNAGVLNGMWLHAFLLYCKHSEGMIERPVKSMKGFLVFHYIFYYKKSFLKKREREVQVGNQSETFSFTMFERCHQASLMFLGTSICHQWLERPICSSGVSFANADTICILTSPPFALHFFYLAVLPYCVKVA